jgi:hypothetical protein
MAEYLISVEAFSMAQQGNSTFGVEPVSLGLVVMQYEIQQFPQLIHNLSDLPHQLAKRQASMYATGIKSQVLRGQELATTSSGSPSAGNRSSSNSIPAPMFHKPHFLDHHWVIGSFWKITPTKKLLLLWIMDDRTLKTTLDHEELLDRRLRAYIEKIPTEKLLQPKILDDVCKQFQAELNNCTWSFPKGQEDISRPEAILRKQISLFLLNNPDGFPKCVLEKQFVNDRISISRFNVVVTKMCSDKQIERVKNEKTGEEVFKTIE